MPVHPRIIGTAIWHGGFTLVELMVTLTVAAILMDIAIPSMQDLVASQRVRAAASELMSALSLARADAISNGRRVAVAPLDQSNDVWSSGWRVIVCAPPSGAQNCPNVAECTDAAAAAATPAACPEELLRHQPLGGNIKVCARLNPAAAVVDTPAIVFGADGRISANTPGSAVGINAFMISDDMGGSAPGSEKMRALAFAAVGRVSLYQVSAAQGGVACP
ncbi:MAG TPA: GspH/FimT family pseudopilin [Rhodocyclaceae bacterium]|nr:GspH/FimT family pseudopilin [Rhodocyclaceae bacterium]